MLRQDQNVFTRFVAGQHCSRRVDSLREQPRDLPQPVRVAVQHLDRIVDDEVIDLSDRLYGRALRHVEQHAHFAEHRTGGLDGGDMLAVTHHFELAVLEDVELAGLAALLDERHSWRDPVASEPGIGQGRPP